MKYARTKSLLKRAISENEYIKKRHGDADKRAINKKNKEYREVIELLKREEIKILGKAILK